MKVVDPFASENAEPPRAPAPDPRYTYTASRVLAGHCPECGRVLVVFNDGESWPLLGCPCGWSGPTAGLPTVRLDRVSARDVLVDVRGYFPSGSALRVTRPAGEPVLGSVRPSPGPHPNEPARAPVEYLGAVHDVGFVDIEPERMTGRASVVVRGPEAS